MRRKGNGAVAERRNGENFPVASWLISPARRPHIRSFYRFARTADNIADDPDMAVDDKAAWLANAENILRGNGAEDAGSPAVSEMYRSLADTGLPPDHCLDLLAAFRRDLVQNRYGSWSDLMDYCRLSAAPVGRFVLDLHGEKASTYRAADALCAALQVINHLQDCRDDYLTLDRIYIPSDWLGQAGLDEAALASAGNFPSFSQVIDQARSRINDLLADAVPLAASIKDRRLAMEVAGIHRIASALARELRYAPGSDSLARPHRATLVWHFAAGVIGRAVSVLRETE